MNPLPDQRPPLEYIPPQSAVELPGSVDAGGASSGITPAGPASRNPFTGGTAEPAAGRPAAWESASPDPAGQFPGFTPITNGGESSRATEESTEDTGVPTAPWQAGAPAGFTAVPSPHAAEPEHGAHEKPAEDEPTDSRAEIEDWMAQLRSARRPVANDEGRHHGGEGRTVSVNELLRRREDETD